jgi:hypothetical protein
MVYAEKIKRSEKERRCCFHRTTMKNRFWGESNYNFFYLTILKRNPALTSRLHTYVWCKQLTV